MQRLFEPVDPASLAVFRISFGVLMLWEIGRYFAYDWIRRYYITPGFHFTYYGFGWVSPWPGDGMVLHFLVLAVLAACVAAGFMYRAAALLFFVGFTYVFLLEQARYLNHFYFISLLSPLLAIVPAHAIWSVDARFRRAPLLVPRWALWLLRFQIAIPYVYGGLAKINTDWLQGEPMRAWLTRRADLPWVGPLLTREPVVMLVAWGGLLIDLLVVPLLLWKRTRFLGLALAVLFHVVNSQLFTIGVFPPLMFAATLLFFPPDWPRHLARGRAGPDDRVAPSPAEVSSTRARRLVLVGLGIYCAIQILVPFRHWLYPGDVAWTEEGHRFSWRMKLRDKEAAVELVAFDAASGREWKVDTQRYLARWQYEEMASRPDMILQFAQHLGREVGAREGVRVGVRALAAASLHGRRRQPLIDPAVDLTRVPRDLRPASWIVPLYEPLPGR